MKQLLQNISRQQLALFICCVLLASLIYSKFALSLCMIALFLIAFFDLQWDKSFPLRFNPAFRQNLRQFWTYKPYLFLSLYFFIILFSGFYSADQDYWLERLRLKIPFLLSPFAFAAIPPFSKKQFLSLFYFLLILLFISSLQVGFHYWQNFESINILMSQGHPMKTPMSHIRYSLLMALSVLGGAYLIFKGFYLKFPSERYLIAGLTLSLFAFMHILSVRSGLLALYLALILLSLAYVFRTGKVWIGLLTVVVLISLPLLAYQYVPSFNAKARYAIWDFQMYLAGTEGTASDSERIISLQLGTAIGLENPVTGIGAGDLRQEMTKRYTAAYPQLPVKMPHNQFVSVFAGSGILGLIAFCIAFFYPLFYRRNYLSPLIFTLHLVIFISFMMENTLETSIGVALYLNLLLIGLNYRSGVNEEGSLANPMS